MWVNVWVIDDRSTGDVAFLFYAHELEFESKGKATSVLLWVKPGAKIVTFLTFI